MGKIIQKLKYLISKFLSAIYDILVTYPVTKAIYKHFGTKILSKDFPASKLSQKSLKGITMLDIGTGTGTALKSIINQVNFSKVTAIDINEPYLKIATKKFSKIPNVEVKKQDFLTFIEDGNTEKFDVVFFGMSFMLMPDKKKALDVARRILKPGGKIYTFLTLYHKKNKIAEFVKPRLKKFTGIDFGDVLYYKQVKKNS